jgi:hypothetical protein
MGDVDKFQFVFAIFIQQSPLIEGVVEESKIDCAGSCQSE